MNEIILRVWLQLKEMPLFLRFLTVISPAGILMILACLIPLRTYGINGSVVSYGEFWASGGGSIGIAGGALIATIGVGIFERRKCTKQLIAAVVVTQDVLALMAVGEAQKDEILGGLVFFIFLNALSVWYLFFKKSVKSYFESERDVQQTGDAGKPHTL